MNEIISVLKCECKPGFTWKNSSTYKAHFKSQRHINYDKITSELNSRKEVTKINQQYNILQNKHTKLNNEYTTLKELYLKLLYENEDLKNRIKGIAELYNSLD